jgi:hypothetical protein
MALALPVAGMVLAAKGARILFKHLLQRNYPPPLA